MEVERHPEALIKVSNTIALMGPLPFSALFSAEIINAPRYGKVKMPTVDLYNGNIDERTIQVLFGRAKGDHINGGIEKSHRLHSCHQNLR